MYVHTMSWNAEMIAHAKKHYRHRYVYVHISIIHSLALRRSAINIFNFLYELCCTCICPPDPPHSLALRHSAINIFNFLYELCCTCICPPDPPAITNYFSRMDSSQ